jgi:hypothetical protein
MADITGLQDNTNRLSSREELLKAATTTTNAVPSHKPEVPKQSCTNVATGIVHEWWAGAWH